MSVILCLPDLLLVVVSSLDFGFWIPFRYKKKKMLSSDDEEPLPPPIKTGSWILHVSPPNTSAPCMDGPPSPPMLSLGVKKSTYVRYVFFFSERSSR